MRFRDGFKINAFDDFAITIGLDGYRLGIGHHGAAAKNKGGSQSKREDEDFFHCLFMVSVLSVLFALMFALITDYQLECPDDRSTGVELDVQFPVEHLLL